jgi:acetamidase/formamidase
VRIDASRTHNRWSPDLEPVASVEPGDELTLVTLDGFDTQLTRASTYADVAARDRGRAHPVS